MMQETGSNVRELWRYLPWGALLLGLTLTLLMWRTLSLHELTEIGWATQLGAEAIRTDLMEDMEWQRTGLDRLALLWEHGDSTQELWTSNAELYIQHRPGCLGVEWIAADGTRRTVVTKNRILPMLAYDGMPAAAMAAARDARAAVFSMPVAVGDGGTQWAVVQPVYARDQLRGYIASFFDAGRSIDDNLADVMNLGFSFVVLLPNQPELAPPGTNREYEKQWARTISVPLPGVTWQLRVWPNPDTLNRVRSLLPGIALIVGIVLSMLTFLTLYFAIAVTRSSGRVRSANEALQREIAVREGAEKELRLAHKELDQRVRERTAELATANLLLQREIAGHEHAEDSLRELTGRVFRLRDEEQRRLARELHDGPTQTLVALAMNLAMIRDTIPDGDPGARRLVSDSARLLQQCVHELRTISYLLHPPLLNELGLAAALQDFAEGFSARSGIVTTLEIDPGLHRLDHQLELTVFRVVQEALSNVHRHAQSRTAKITLREHSGSLHLEIADSGRGIPLEILAATGSKLTGVGIAGMRERVRISGGKLEITSDSRGTRIDVSLPVSGSSATKAVASSAEVSAGGSMAAA